MRGRQQQDYTLVKCPYCGIEERVHLNDLDVATTCLKCGHITRGSDCDDRSRGGDADA